MLRAERQSDRMSIITNDGLTRSAWHMVLYNCTHMATVGVKWLRVDTASYTRFRPYTSCLLRLLQGCGVQSI